MIGKSRKFSKKAHTKYDLPARKVILEKLGDGVIENPNIYEQDFIITSQDCKYKFLEVQVCAGWVNDNYPYSILSTYERKGKYGGDTLFITFNNQLTKCCIFDRKSFSEKPRRLKKYCREFVFDIPWDKALIIDVEGLKMLTLNEFATY